MTHHTVAENLTNQRGAYLVAGVDGIALVHGRDTCAVPLPVGAELGQAQIAHLEGGRLQQIGSRSHPRGTPNNSPTVCKGGKLSHNSDQGSWQAEQRCGAALLHAAALTRLLLSVADASCCVSQATRGSPACCAHTLPPSTTCTQHSNLTSPLCRHRHVCFKCLRN